MASDGTSGDTEDRRTGGLHGKVERVNQLALMSCTAHNAQALISVILSVICSLRPTRYPGTAYWHWVRPCRVGPLHTSSRCVTASPRYLMRRQENRPRFNRANSRGRADSLISRPNTGTNIPPIHTNPSVRRTLWAPIKLVAKRERSDEVDQHADSGPTFAGGGKR